MNYLIVLILILISIINSLILNKISERFLAILQQNYYKNIKSLKWILNIKNSYFNNMIYAFIIYCSVYCVGLFFLKYKYIFLIYVIFTNLIMLIYLLIKTYKLPKLKLKLNKTKRIYRLIFTFVLIGILINLNIFLIYYFMHINILFLIGLCNFMFFIFVCIANLINLPIEIIIKKYFIHKAKCKLKYYPNLLIIGITGSYGKTTTKNYLYELLSKQYSVLMTEKSFNTDMGIVKTILEKLNSAYEIFIVEMGADHNNDIKKLCKIVAPNIAIITSVGNQHLGTFKNVDNIINTKFQIVQFAKKPVKFFTNINNKICKLYYDNVDCEKYAISSNGYGDIVINNVVYDTNTVINFKYNNKNYKLCTNVIGKYNIENLVLAILVALKLNIKIFNIKKIIQNLNQISNRLQLKKIKNDSLIIDDSFNCNLNGCKQSLEILNSFSNKKIIITCGIVELGSEQFNENYLFGKEISKVANIVCIVNKINYKAIIKGLIEQNFNKNNIYYFEGFIDAYKFVYDNFNNFTLLIENDLTDNYIIN